MVPNSCVPSAAILDDQTVCGRGERLALALAREQINGIIEVPAKARVEVDIFELQRDSQYETTDTSEQGHRGRGVRPGGWGPSVRSSAPAASAYHVLFWLHLLLPFVSVLPSPSRGGAAGCGALGSASPSAAWEELRASLER